MQKLPRKCQQQVSKASYVRSREEQLSREKRVNVENDEY